MSRFSKPLSPADLSELLRHLLSSSGSPGVRLSGKPGLDRWLRAGPVGQAVASIMGSKVRPVRAIMFNKTEQANWALAWHQDRTIAVRARGNAPGFGPWTIKSGTQHVEPPFHFIETMLTARVHIDAVDSQNAPLLVAPGSHRSGRIVETDIDSIVARCGAVACNANEGDVWFYRTAILHASEAARRPGRRRVLQVDFSAEDLPAPMDWLGIG